MQRRIRNVVNNYTPTEIKVREATSNDPWGPSSILLSEISTLTFNVLSRGEVMGIVWRRLNDHGKNWRHVYKSLVLLNFLVRTGSDWVVRECRDNIIFIQTLRDFQHSENGLDCGLNIREAAKKLYELLKDERKLREERHKAQKSRLGDSRVYSSSIGDLTSDQYSNSNNHFSQKDEDEELRLALALSKKEHDAEETKRRNDEVRLKMALEESKRTAQLDKERVKPFVPSLVDQDDPWLDSKSAPAMANPWDMGGDLIGGVDDSNKSNHALLASLGATGAGTGLMSYPGQSQTSNKTPCDDDFDEIIHRGLVKNINNNNIGQASALKSSSLGDLLSGLDDDFMYSSNNNYNNNNNFNNNNYNFSNDNNNYNFSNKTTDLNIDFSLNNNNNFSSNDNFNKTISNNNNNNKASTDDVMASVNLLSISDEQQAPKTKKKTAEEFLGDNAKLVNLEQLVVMPTKQDNNNPFALTSTKTSVNPFSHIKQPQKVPLNQLQASSQPPSQSAAFMPFDSSFYNQPANQMIPNQGVPSFPPILPAQPPTAYNNNYNPFL